MSRKVFKSKLGIDEIEGNFRDVDFFNGLEEGLDEALAYEKGNAKAGTLTRKRSLTDGDADAGLPYKSKSRHV